MVVNNEDPLGIGRLQAIVPDVSNIMLSSWAMPCVPMAGIQTGFLAVPPIGSGVWMEFEQGDPDYPIWVGCYWGDEAEIPSQAKEVALPVQSITLQTFLQNGISLSDLPGPTGGIVIKSTTGASLIVNDTGIYIQNGKGASITLVGPTVSVNDDALTVI